MKAIFAATFLIALTACQAGADAPADGAGLPGDAENTAPFAEIAPDSVIRFTGTEPFWGGRIEGSTLTWSTPENQPGEAITVTRFAGRGGLNFSGILHAESFDMAVTPAACSDGMSDRTYPFAATVKLGAEELNGCAWRDSDDLGEAP